MILEEWAMSDIYSVNKKVKDGSKNEPPPYGCPCIDVYQAMTGLCHKLMFKESPEKR